MLAHESAANLFQRLNRKTENRYDEIIQRLNRYHDLLFPHGFQNQLIELLDQHRFETKRFLHGFIRDYVDYIKSRNELLILPFQTQDIFSNSPQANKDSVESEIPTLEFKFNYDQSIAFIYIDTESKECPFENNNAIEWYDCQTSSELVSTLLRLEQSHFINASDQHYVLIIDSSTQVPTNDYYRTTTFTQVMSIEENRLLTVQWHSILCYLIAKYRLSCILVEHLDIETPLFDTIIGKRDEKSMRRNSKNKEIHVPYSEFAFGRLLTSERYQIHQFQYRQIHHSQMKNLFLTHNHNQLNEHNIENMS